MKYLILDTNIYVRDFQMRGHDFNALLNNHRLVAEKYGVLKVVADQVISQLEKKVRTEIDIVTKSQNKLRKYLGGIFEPVQQKEISHIVSEYKALFHDRLLNTNYEFIDYPEVTSQVLAEKAMSRRKPFKANGEGVCDAIIWEAIVDLLSSDSSVEVIFVTDNIKDFCDDRGIHSHLLEDLVQKNISKNRIIHYPGLDDLVKDLVLPYLQTLDELQSKLSNNTFSNFDFNDWISNQLYVELDPNDIGKSLYGITTQDCEILLSEVYEIKAMNIESVQAINVTSRYVRIQAEIGVSLDICASYGQHEDNQFLEDLFNSWNAFPSPYDCASKSDFVVVQFTLSFEGDDVAGGSIEVNTVKGKMSVVDCN